MKFESYKKPIIIITYAIILYFLVNHFNTFLSYIAMGTRILSPVILGLCIAFIVNLILRFYEKKIFNRVFAKAKDGVKKIKRPLCVVLSYLTVVGIIVVIMNFIVPQITESIKALTGNLPSYMQTIGEFFYNLTKDYKITEEAWKKIVENMDVIISNTSQVLNTALPKILSLTKGVTAGVTDLFIGIVFSVYMLLSKEKLLMTLKKIIYAHLSIERANKISDVFYRANKVFRSFVAGQLIEAVILGVLCYIGMRIFRMPYAPLISVIIGLTSIVPVIGAFVGTIPGAFLILLENPIMALWFVLFIIVLQQLEGNIIYPRVVGSAIGLSGFWVLLAVTVGGGLFGVKGIIIGVPMMAVIYALYSEFVSKRLKERDITLVRRNI